MPELPEVETVCRGLAAHLLDRRIERVAIFQRQVVHRPKEDSVSFSMLLQGRCIHRVERRGKYIILVLDEGWLVCHLRMTGKLLMKDGAYQKKKHDHLIFYLDNESQLVYEDVRRFGGVGFYSASPYTESPLSILGPEPLQEAFSSDYLYQCCQGRRKPIKSMILDQYVVAGIGNIYADEILFRAEVRPLKSAYRIRKIECERIVQVTKDVLQEAILAGGSTIRDYVNSDNKEGSFQLLHRVYGRSGEPCVKCGTSLKKVNVGGRSSVYCPHCQKS